MVSTTTTIIVITTITTTTTVTQAGQQRGSVPYLVLKFLDESCSISNFEQRLSVDDIPISDAHPVDP